MAASYSGARVNVLVGNADAVYDLEGDIGGTSVTPSPQIESDGRVGSLVSHKDYNSYNIDLAMTNLKRGVAAKAMQAWVESVADPEAWMAVLYNVPLLNDSIPANQMDAETGQRCRFGRRIFTAADFTSDFATIVGQNITCAQAGTVYRGPVFRKFEFDGTGDPTLNLGDIAATDTILYFLTSVTGSPILTVAGAATNITADTDGTVLNTATITASPTATLEASGTFTACEGWVVVGKPIN